MKENGKLIIEDNTIYELDEECLACLKKSGDAKNIDNQETMKNFANGVIWQREHPKS